MKIISYSSQRFPYKTVLTNIGYGIDAKYNRFRVWVMQAAPFVFVIRMQRCPPRWARDWWEGVCMHDANKPTNCFVEFLNNCQKMDEIILVEDINYQHLRNIIERVLPCRFMWMNV